MASSTFLVRILSALMDSSDVTASKVLHIGSRRTSGKARACALKLKNNNCVGGGEKTFIDPFKETEVKRSNWLSKQAFDTHLSV